MGAGTVKLFYKNTEFESADFPDRSKRRRFIEYWKRKHGEAFNEMYLLIIPTDLKGNRIKKAKRSFVGWERKKIRQVERNKKKRSHFNNKAL